MATANVLWEPGEVKGVWIAHGPEEGPTVGVLTGVHPDETTGIQVANESLFTLNVERGHVILMLGNLAAMELAPAGKRFKDDNLNRWFRELSTAELNEKRAVSYEVNRAQELLPYLDECGALLDLHEYTDPDGHPFIICERNALDTAQKLGAPVISFGWSKTEPGASDGYMYAQGKEGICYEVGCKKFPNQNIARGHGVLARFLAAQEVTDQKLPPLYDNPLLVEALYAFIKTEEDYRLARDDFKTFEPLKPGELIAVHDGREIRAEEGQVIIFPEKDPPIGTEAFSIGQIVTA